MKEINLSPAIRTGFRGYVASRPVRGSSFPQHVQNLVIRDYASRLRLHYLLSVTEYAMPSCYMMLSSLLEELPRLNGVIFFSLFMLPPQKLQRLKVYETVLENDGELHAALENIALRKRDDISDIEDLLDVAFTLPALPLSGRYEKNDSSSEDRGRDPFWLALTSTL